MHLRVSGKTMLLKWAIPVILVVAMLGFFGLRAWGGSSSGGGLGDDTEFTDYNPAYSDEMIVPAEGATGPGGVFVLYSIEVTEPTSMIPLDSTTAGALLTATVTNNIGEAIANNTHAGVCNNGDILGNLVISAEVYHVGVDAMSGFGLTSYCATPAHTVGIAKYNNIIIHPGKSFTAVVPEAAISEVDLGAGPQKTGFSVGDIVLYKAEFVNATACFDPAYNTTTPVFASTGCATTP